MDFLNDTEGTVLFPFQTEIAFVLAIITTAKDLSVSAWGHIGQKQYWSAWALVHGWLNGYHQRQPILKCVNDAA